LHAATWQQQLQQFLPPHFCVVRLLPVWLHRLRLLAVFTRKQSLQLHWQVSLHMVCSEYFAVCQLASIQDSTSQAAVAEP
jgi:hypothetical protein